MLFYQILACKVCSGYSKELVWLAGWLVKVLRICGANYTTVLHLIAVKLGAVDQYQSVHVPNKMFCMGRLTVSRVIGSLTYVLGR